MDWKSYEEIVKYLYENIGLKNGLTIEGYGRSCVVKGKSSVNHQIDVLFSHTDGAHKYFTAIECKYWNDKVNKDVIMKMIEVIDDCKIDKGIIVSKHGFTKDTIDFANFKNIGLVELREPHDIDPKLVSQSIDITLIGKAQFYDITKLIIESDENDTSKDEYLKKLCYDLVNLPIEIKTQYVVEYAKKDNPNHNIERISQIPVDRYKIVLRNMSYLQLYTTECILFFNDGLVKNVHDIILNTAKTKIYTSYPEVVMRDEISLNPSVLFVNKHDSFNCKINKIIIEGKYIVQTQSNLIKIRNRVLMIMKLIFENKMFILTNDGKVNEISLEK